LDDSTILYIAGSNFVIYNKEKQIQTFVPIYSYNYYFDFLNEGFAQKDENLLINILQHNTRYSINVMEVCYPYVAISMRTSENIPLIEVFDINNPKKKKILYGNDTSTVIISISSLSLKKIIIISIFFNYFTIIILI